MLALKKVVVFHISDLCFEKSGLLDKLECILENSQSEKVHYSLHQTEQEHKLVGLEELGHQHKQNLVQFLMHHCKDTFVQMFIVSITEAPLAKYMTGSNHPISLELSI